MSELKLDSELAKEPKNEVTASSGVIEGGSRGDGDERPRLTERDKLVLSKLFIFFMALLVGAIVVFVTGKGQKILGLTIPKALGWKIALTLGVAILYGVLSAGAIQLSGVLVRFCGEKGEWETWTVPRKLFLGAVWPMALPYVIIVYVFLGIIRL